MDFESETVSSTAQMNFKTTKHNPDVKLHTNFPNSNGET